MQKVITILAAVFICGVFSFFKPSSKEKINWLSLVQLKEAYAKDPRPILIDVYTNWCGWCKVMDKQTYQKENVVQYINEHYYAIKLNAEDKNALEFNGKTYPYNHEYKSNELAVYLLYGQMSFPSTVFLSDLNAQPAPLPGFLKPNEIEAPLKYFGERNDKRMTFQQFNSTFKPTW